MADHQKYRITERVDAGGMAEVFRGIAESLQGFKKSVAIKRILPHLTKNKKFIQMFLDEARLSLHLQHTNIVGVFDIGVSPAGPDGTPGSYFIVMEFVDGTHLKGIVESLRRQGRRLSVAQVLYVLMQVCNGLAYAHDATDPENGRPLGIVHRDISPPNILISKNGEVKLVDFGLAKATSQLESTDPGVVKGKFSYLSPEAALGREVDRRADIFAVGILLYELLSGKRLFYGETDYATVELVRAARVPSLRQQNPEVDDELESIVRRALARDLNQRFQTAGELHDAIAQYLFSRGLKVTSRDVAQLVQACLAERARSQPVLQPQKSLIDTLILEELNKFTSLDGSEAIDGLLGARPLSPDELNGSSPLPISGPKPLVHAEDLVDTSSWSEELTGDKPREPPIQLVQPVTGRERSGRTSLDKAGTSRSGRAGRSGSHQPTPPVVPAVHPRRGRTPAAGTPISGDVGLADLLEGTDGRSKRPVKTPQDMAAQTELLPTVKTKDPSGRSGGPPPIKKPPALPDQKAPTNGTRTGGGRMTAAIVVAVVMILLVGGGAFVLFMRSRGH